MPNDIKNRINIIGTKEQINEVFKKLSTHFPREKRRTHNGELIFKHKTEEHVYGFLNEKTNIFTQGNLNPVEGVIDCFEQDYTEAWTRFPDFNKIIPMPEALNIEDGSYGAIGYSVITGKTENIFSGIDLNLDLFWKASIDIKKEMIQRGFSYAENMENYGYTTWYSWSNEKWGTKWNSYNCQHIKDGIFDFETAWNGVPKLIYKISEMFPNLKFYYSYSDEDIGYNCGHGCIENGNGIIKQLLNGSNEAYKLAIELHPESEKYYKIINNKYVSIEM